MTEETAAPDGPAEEFEAESPIAGIPKSDPRNRVYQDLLAGNMKLLLEATARKVAIPESLGNLQRINLILELIWTPDQLMDFEVMYEKRMSRVIRERIEEVTAERDKASILAGIPAQKGRAMWVPGQS